MTTDNHPGWEYIVCGCCGGLQWGGEQPTECGICKGWASYWIHSASKRMAAYPGGPFLGRVP